MKFGTTAPELPYAKKAGCQPGSFSAARSRFNPFPSEGGPMNIGPCAAQVVNRAGRLTDLSAGNPHRERWR